MKACNRLLALILIPIVFMLMLGAYTNAETFNLVSKAEEHSPQSLSQITAASDTSDVLQVKSMSHTLITFHLIVASIDDSVHVKFQGSIDNAESTYSNLDTTGNPTKLTVNGCHVFQFSAVQGFYYYRWIKVSESGGTDVVISSFATLGREYR